MFLFGEQQEKRVVFAGRGGFAYIGIPIALDSIKRIFGRRRSKNCTAKGPLFGLLNR
jgi:hypothetical protein